MNNTITYQIETLTPLHIGSGRDLGYNFDYLKMGKEAVLTDSKKILQILGEYEQSISAWVSAIDNKEDILAFIKKRKPNVTAADIAERILTIQQLPNEKPIKEQLHLGSPQRPVLPGSSIKGSMRTALLTKLIYEKPDFVQTPSNLGKTRHQTFEYKDAAIAAHYLAPNPRNSQQPEPKTDLFRLLRVGDAYFEAQTCVLQNNSYCRDSWDNNIIFAME